MSAVSYPLSFGSYELLGEISRGGMAEVHFAIRRSDKPQRVYAIKRILPQHASDPAFRRFFSAEIELSKSLQHPSVVATIDYGEVDRSPFLAMEYIHGRALNRLLYALGAQGRRLPVPFAVYIAMKSLEGLEYIHHARDPQGRRIDAVICDISPSNIMVGYDGSIKLIDFGIATSRLRFFEQIGMLKGKKNYMSPEQLRGLPLDHRADIFAMGLCLFELITAQAVFSGKSDFEVEEAVRSGRLPTLSERVANLPHGLEDVVQRALALSPTDRYASAGEFARALEPFARLGKGTPVGPQELSKVLPVYIAGMIKQDDQRLADVLARIEHQQESFQSEGAAAPGDINTPTASVSVTGRTGR